ncbi:MAG TPA: hypothetical protein DCY57_09575 [Bacteroidetes bacterium]|nr:hypothetical protein [Bacteroidota bacterium]
MFRLTHFTTLFLLVVCMIGVVATSACGSREEQLPAISPKIASGIQGANQALSQGDLNRALSKAEDVLAVDPSSVDGHFLKGRVLFELGRFSAAESSFVIVANQHPAYPGVFHNLANISYLRKEYRAALSRFLQESQLESDPRSWHAVAGVYAELGVLDSALVAIESSLAIKDTYAPAWLSRAMYTEQAGDLSNALSYGRRSYQLDASKTTTWLLVARLENQIGTPDSALVLMQRMSEQDPFNYTALFEMGRSFQRMGNVEAANQMYVRSDEVRKIMKPVELLETDVREYPQRFSQRVQLAEANRAIGRWDQALKQYQSAVSMRPGNTELLSNVALMMVQLGQRDRAQNVFLDILESEPNHFPTLVNMTVFYLEVGNLEEAALYFNRARGQQPDNPVISRLASALGSTLE